MLPPQGLLLEEMFLLYLIDSTHGLARKSSFRIGLHAATKQEHLVARARTYTNIYKQLRLEMWLYLSGACAEFAR